MNFNPNWLMRPGRADVTTPKFVRRQIRRHAVELRVVQRVERLEPELQPRAASELEVLEQREIQVVHSGPAQDVPPRGAEAPRPPAVRTPRC